MIAVYSHDANCLRLLSPRNIRNQDVPCIPFALTGRRLSDRALAEVAANGYGPDMTGERFTFIRLGPNEGITPTNTNGATVVRTPDGGISLTR